MKNNKISMARLAEMCNVSQGTVDRALHNRKGISEKTKEHILAAAKEYGYRPNKYKNEKSGLVGIIVFDLYNEYFSELIVELEKSLRNCGYYSLVMFSGKDKKAELECIEAMYDAGVDAIIICPINDGTDFAKYLKSWKIPVLTVGNKIEGIKYIGIDNFSAMMELTEMILRKNYKKFIYFSPVIENSDCNIYAQEERFKGFEKAINAYRDISCLIVTDEKKLKGIVTPDMVIVASNDYYALKIMFSGVAENCIIIGFDNISSIFRYKIPMLTVDYDKVSLAKSVVNYIEGNSTDEDEFIGYKVVGEDNI